MRIQTKKVISCQEWDKTVMETYGRPYCFQQQDGCKERGSFDLTVPEEAEEFDRDTVPEVVNHRERGVSFAAWLKRDPKLPVGGRKDAIGIWWGRNFYPDVQMIANDLHAKGLLKAGTYTIDIDW